MHKSSLIFNPYFFIEFIIFDFRWLIIFTWGKYALLSVLFSQFIFQFSDRSHSYYVMTAFLYQKPGKQ